MGRVLSALCGSVQGSLLDISPVPHAILEGNLTSEWQIMGWILTAGIFLFLSEAALWLLSKRKLNNANRRLVECQVRQYSDQLDAQGSLGEEQRPLYEN